MGELGKGGDTGGLQVGMTKTVNADMSINLVAPIGGFIVRPDSAETTDGREGPPVETRAMMSVVMY